MGTNYYLVKDVGIDEIMEAFDLPNKIRIHVGKRSNGWPFMFHAVGMIESWSQWQNHIIRCLSAGWELEDEHGVSYTLDEFVTVVEKTKHHRRHIKESTLVGEWLDDEGWPFYGYDFN